MAQELGPVNANVISVDKLTMMCNVHHNISAYGLL
jgi:hypothetical protein